MKRPSRNEGATSSRQKQKREESVSAEECFEVWRKTRSEESLSQETANMNRWFNDSLTEILPRKSLEELGDIGLLEEYYRQEFAEEHKQLEKSFFECDAVTLARQLLGKFLFNGDCIILKITEVEVYQEGDSAFKSRFGGQGRTPALYESGGMLFERGAKDGVFSPLYIVADKEGVGAGVLIKACSPVAGLEVLEIVCQTGLMRKGSNPSYCINWEINCHDPPNGLGIIQARRDTLSTEPMLLNGPEKVAQALRAMCPDFLYEPYGIQLLDGAKPQSILVGPRVCGQHATPRDLSKPWRFAIAGTPWVSKPHDTLVPLT